MSLDESTRRLNEHDRRMRELEESVAALAMLHLVDPVDPVTRERAAIKLRAFMNHISRMADEELAEAEL